MLIYENNLYTDFLKTLSRWSQDYTDTRGQNNTLDTTARLWHPSWDCPLRGFSSAGQRWSSRVLQRHRTFPASAWPWHSTLRSLSVVRKEGEKTTDELREKKGAEGRVWGQVLVWLAGGGGHLPGQVGTVLPRPLEPLSRPRCHSPCRPWAPPDPARQRAGEN